MPDLPFPPDKLAEVHPPAGPKPVVCVAVNGMAFTPERIDGIAIQFPKDPAWDVQIQVRLTVKRGEVAEAIRILAGVAE